MKNLTKLFITLGFFATQLAFGQAALCPAKNLKAIKLTGLDVTQEKVVLRELSTKVGDPLNCQKIEADKKTLMGLEIFSGIEHALLEEENSITLIYEFKEMPAYLIVPSIAKTDQEGWLASLNLATLNLNGLDIRSQLTYRTNFHPKFNTSNEFYSYLSSPWLFDQPLEYLFLLGKTQSYNSLKEFDEDSYRNEIRLYYRLKNKLQIKAHHLGKYYKHTDDLHQWYDLGGWDVLLGYGVGLKYEDIDNPKSPMEGISVEIEYMPNFLNNSTLQYHSYDFDFRSWNSYLRNILHTSTMLRYRQGDVAFYEAYHLGGINSLRGYTPEPTRAYKNEWLSTLEYRYQIVPLTSYQLPVLGWNLFWGLEAALGWDFAVNWNDSSNSDYRHSPYVGIHLLQPGIQRIRFEVGLEEFSLNYSFAVGFYEKTTTQKWHGR